MKFKSVILTVLSLLIILFLPTITEAGVGLSVFPQKYEITVFPGDSYEGEFKIHNPNDIALPVTLNAIPFGAEDSTGDLILDAEDERGAVRWISFNEDNLLLSPGEDARVEFNIDVPSETPEGGYYIFTRFELIIPDFDDSSTRVVPSVGVPIMIATTDLALDEVEPDEDLMEIRNFALSSERRSPLEGVLGQGRNVAWAQQEEIRRTQVSRGQPNKFILDIQNNDIFHVQPRGTLTIYDALNRKVAETDFRGQTILPKMSREFLVSVEDDDWKREETALQNIYASMMSGRYRAELDLRGDSPLRGEIRVKGETGSLDLLSSTVFIFWISVLVFMIIGFLIRGRLKMMLRILIKGNK